MAKITTLITKGRRAPLGTRRRRLVATNIESDSNGRIWACVGRKCKLIRTRRGFVHPKKGQKSWTMKGRKDFTTKKGNKYFNRKGKRQTRSAKGIKRRPYNKRAGCASCKGEKWGSEIEQEGDKFGEKLGHELDAAAHKAFSIF